MTNLFAIVPATALALVLIILLITAIVYQFGKLVDRKLRKSGETTPSVFDRVSQGDNEPGAR